MNKAELIESIGGRLGDKKAATAALDAVLAEIQKAVTKGDKVSLTGFGVFERRERAARTARNPRTGETVKVKKTAVPVFRPGTGFKELVAVGRAPKATKAATKTAPAKKSATAKAMPAKKAPATRAATKTASKAAAPAKRAATGTTARRPAAPTKAPTKAPTRARATRAAR